MSPTPVDQSDNRHHGGCRCGAVRFSIDDDPEHVSYCHCADCRRATGAPVTAFVGFATERVSFTGERPATWVSGPVTRSFCVVCGSPIAYFDRRIGGRVYFLLGAMDAPQNYRPTLHAHVAEKLPFLHMPDGLPRFDGTSVARPRETTETAESRTRSAD
ncbi:MAG: aldehyde-activating protein [Alphaproteobacteria bacterium]|nr:MAG: aldehyde-activating protein [Alphaproteobacteria bacterium]